MRIKNEVADALEEARRKSEIANEYHDRLVSLLVESQTNIGGDWRQRRDDLLYEIKGTYVLNSRGGEST